MKFDVLFLLTCFVYKSANGFRDPKIISTINDLLDGLALEKWDQEDLCRHDTEAILNGVKNNTLWASWVWDSMQLPVGTFYGSLYHLGNFDQCLNMPWPDQGVQTQYCLVDVKLTSLHKHDEEQMGPYGDVERYIGTKFRHGMRLNTIFLGVCLPASCKPKSIAKISRHIFRLSHLPFRDIMVDPRDCQVAGIIEKSTGYYVFWIMILAMASICISVYFFGNTQNKSDSAVSKIICCFCLTRNFDALTEVYKDEIKTILGMRSLTCAIITLAHVLFMSQSIFFNQIDVEKELLDNPLSKLSLHIDLCVDTFFVISGLLYFRGLMSSRSCQPFKTILKRYLRLLFPLYVLSIMCLAYVLPHIGSGPVWPRNVRAIFEPCAKSWWGNLLMVTCKVDGLSFCSVTSWSLHCDFQLSILVTVIFMVYKRNQKTGIIFISFAFVLSLVLPAIWNYCQEVPGLLWYDFGECLNMKTNKVFKSVYIPFYTRASSYLIGVMMGYIMSVYKPQNNRKTISKFNSILGFIIGMSLLVFCLQVGVKMFKRELGVLSTAIVAALDRTIWSIGICIIIIVCEYGTLPIINDFLSSKVFVPLSKLTYSCYLYHIVFIYRDVYTLRTPVRFDMFGLITNGLGYVVVSNAVCFLIWLFIESPGMNLINLLLDHSPKIIKEDIHEAKKTAKVL